MSADSDGKISGVEGRASVLEARVNDFSPRLERAESKVDTLSERITRAEERIAHLPTKEQVVKIALGTLAAIAALIAFQAKIKLFFGP
jgi:phage shock protein A